MSHPGDHKSLWQSLALAFVLLGAFGVACNDPEQDQYENRLHRELDAFEFERPIEEVWPELIQVLAEDGYVLDQKTPVEGRTLATELKPDAHGGYRVLVRVIRRNQQRYRIQLERQYEHNGQKTIEDWNVMGTPTDRLEGALVERTEPERAAQIKEDLLSRARSGCVHW
jgi:hypothetical protein